jgi:hypothetical protein
MNWRLLWRKILLHRACYRDKSGVIRMRLLRTYLGGTSWRIMNMIESVPPKYFCIVQMKRQEEMLSRWGFDLPWPLCLTYMQNVLFGFKAMRLGIWWSRKLLERIRATDKEATAWCRTSSKLIITILWPFNMRPLAFLFWLKKAYILYVLLINICRT